MKSGEFKRIDLSVDEEEHSIEMQLSFIAKVMERYVASITTVWSVLRTIFRMLNMNKPYGPI